MAFRAKEDQATMPAQSSKTRSPAVASVLPRTNGMRPTVPGGTALLKRKAEGGGGICEGPPSKVVRTEGNGSVSRPGGHTGLGSAAGRPIASATGAVGGYKGTARAPARLLQSNITKATPSTPAVASAAANPAPKGYAAVLAKAAAAAEAHKAAASATIVHKPVEKLTKRERERLKQESLEKQKAEKAAGRNGKMAIQAGRSRSGTPGDANAAAKKAPPKIAYQGTMRKLPSAPAASSYKGTMRAVDPAKPAKPQNTTDKFGGQDKYGGYASWSDLDDAEDDDQGDYDSASDMEGGFDEMEEEELASTRLARKEDLEAQAEEERLKKEKLVRKQKLVALSKDARGKKKF